MNQGGFSASEISKSFGALQVLKGVSLTIKPGETLGLLGPNGAGKTTLMKLVAGTVEADKGNRVVTPGTNIEMLEQDQLQMTMRWM